MNSKMKYANSSKSESANLADYGTVNESKTDFTNKIVGNA